jgi:mRNA-degrading endonuclease YafQ of YafQ-DinJ toxin-antitoxin module
MVQALFDPRLKTLALTGPLVGLHASSCGFDCRIVFRLEARSGGERIILIAVGTHDEAY